MVVLSFSTQNILRLLIFYTKHTSIAKIAPPVPHIPELENRILLRFLPGSKKTTTPKKTSWF